MSEQSVEIVSEIWNDSRNRLKNFIARKVDDQADVEDILQDVFCKIHRHNDELKEADKLYSWVFQLTRNAINDYYRMRKINFAGSEEVLHEIAYSPSEKEAEEEVLAWLKPMIEDLPEKHREALFLTDIQGMTQKEFASKMNLSFSGAKSRVQRAREVLREVLTDCCLLEFNRAGDIVEYKQRKPDCSYCTGN